MLAAAPGLEQLNLACPRLATRFLSPLASTRLPSPPLGLSLSLSRSLSLFLSLSFSLSLALSLSSLPPLYLSLSHTHTHIPQRPQRCTRKHTFNSVSLSLSRSLSLSHFLSLSLSPHSGDSAAQESTLFQIRQYL